MKKHRELIKRLVSLFMAFMMTFTCLPLEVFAEEMGGTDIAIEEGASQLIEDNTSSEIHTHVYEDEMTAPTCTEQGFTTHACECGDSYVDTYVEATGHDYKGGKCTACGEKYVFAGKKVSILSHSMSTYAGVSNNTSHNSTIGNNDVYYTVGKHGVYREDTWWQQAIDALGMELLVNNSWSGSCVFMPRKGEASIGYGDRAVNLHNDHTGEKPDIIWVYLGCNDFAYYKDTFGKAADVNYSALIKDNGDGTFTYAAPQTTCEAYAIMLHKVETRYSDAQIYCMTSTARRETDYAGDSYPDAGQPTEYSAQLQLIAKHYGYPVVDLESAIPKDVEIFDKYMGDKRAHANALGMDQISNALLTVMLGEDAEIRHVTSEKGVVAEQAVLLNGSYSAEVNVQQGYDLVVTMGGKDITSKVYSDGKITIANVTGDIEVVVTINREPQNYRWTLDDGELVSVGDTVNSLQKVSGTITDGVINNGRFALSTPVVLKHDRPWAVEWKCAGDWRGVILSSDPATLAPGRMYISRTNGGQLCFGSWNGTQYNNYGVDLSALDAKMHTLRLENRVAADGSNMIWLYVDGAVVDSMDNYFIGSKKQNTTSDWVNGKDFVFPYIGSDSTLLNNCALDYLAVWENGEPATPLALCYDDHYDVTGKTVEIIDAGNKVVTIEGNYLVATGIGEAKVRIEDKLHLVTVEKAKINIVTIMGQSNAGNHFANATSDVTCPIGTAYWWGNGQGVNAAEPVDYTQPSMGFHTPLLAELYAQSVAAGDPVKNVLVWQEGITSKNGQSIVKWAATETDTSGTDGTATMLKNCIAYYEKHSDKFEIVNCGVYWLQGESDVSMEPEKYTKLFMAMWSDLKEAGAEYVAFFRVRKGTIDNDSEHLDLSYSGSLTAQLNMINRNADMFLVSDITENWVGNENVEHVIDVSPYLTVKDVYASTGSYSDAYGNTATYKDGLLTTTMKTLYGSNNKCHYGKFGYGIIGADAAVNMYQALNSEEFSFVMADTSGRVENQRSFKNSDTAKIDITDITENLAFRAACGSTAGTLEIKVTSGCTDITEKVIDKGITTFGTINTELLCDYDNVEIVITYYPVHGNPGKVEIEVVDNTPETAQTFIWDFNEDLNARGNDGTVLNGLNSAALLGEYKIEDGVLKAKGLQLQFTNKIKLSERKNWSIEWKFGVVDESTKGFLLCNTEESKVGTKTVYISPDVKISISDYADNYGTKGYRNYYTDDAAFTSGDVLRIANEYDSEKGRGVLRLWKNGKLIVDDFQKYGNINKTSGTLSNMTGYPLSGDFEVSYLGCKGIENFSVTGEIDYIKIITDEPATPLALRYDDHYDVVGKTVEIINAGKPTSYQVGYGVEENKVLDTAVVTLEGETLVATGIGTAYVRIDGQLYEVAVSSAPISLILLAGQSNMQGSEGNANQSIVCPDGMVYSTYGDRYTMTAKNATNYAPSALTGKGSSLNVNGTTTNLADWPIYLLNENGAGKAGPDSGFAYEWVKQTGEKVWVVNAAHGGTSITVWQDGGTEFEECELLFKACQETLRKEIAAGHFTLSHMAYFWCQGCSDRAQTAEWYVKKYLAMHENFVSEFTFDHDGVASTAEKAFEFGGIIPVRVGNTATCYRDGVYSTANPYAYHESFVDLRFNGPRVAQYWMINNPELSDIWGVCDIGEDWVWMPDGTNGVAEYFQEHYDGGKVDYTPQVTQKAAWYTPTTPAAVHDSIHYNQIGYNEIGRESVRNALIMLGEMEEPDVETTVTFFSWDGITEASKITAATTGASGTLVVPKVYPIWASKDIAYSVSEGLTYQYYDLLANSAEITGTLSAVGAGNESVTVEKAAPYAHFAEHLSLLPENVCCGLNLWPLLAHDDYYYENGTHWGIHSSKNVPSITIAVSPGDKIYASSFGKAGTNGSSGTSGIRVTYFSEYGVVKTLAPAEVYSEFTKNDGYIVAPEGTVAINIPMWSKSDEWEVYIVSASHDTASDICSICGKSSHTHEYSDWIVVREPSAAGVGEEQRVCACGEVISRELKGVWQTLDLTNHLSIIPKDACSELNLWGVLEHDKYYFANGTNWAIYSSREVPSITIPVNPGDKVFATSFGATPNNGHSTSSGIRCTFFDAYGVAKTMTPAETYAEFSRNGGYLVAPENAVAVNIPMWNNSDANEVYLLNYDHTYTSGICTVCGAEDPDYVPTFLYLNEAVAYLREQMKARIDTVTLRIADMELTAEQGNTMLSDAIAHTGVPTEGDYFRRNMGSKSCSVVTGEDANGVYSDVTFKFNWYTTAEMEAEVDAAVEALLDELDLWSASDYEKIVGVYDWIGENIEYDHDRYDEEGSTIEHTTYAAIIDRLAVCQGYASLYYRLLLELGVDCRVISGLAGLNGGESHAWNIVKLEGKYYNADPTWDADLKGHYRYFLCTMENFKEHVRDDEFDSESFHTQYPMSLVPYVVNAAASGSVNGAIAWVLDGETGTLTVAGTGAIPSYRYGSAPWYPYRESVKSIVVSEGITEVGERAFYWCTNCTSVTLPESLVAIREYGFNNLRALQEIKLPSKLTTIEFCAFSECVGLQSIVIPNSVTTIGSSAFSNCYALTSATLSAGMTTIPDSMFFGDRNLKKVVLQNGLTTIGDTAFADCGITSFTIPATVTSIGVSAFAGCRSNNSFTVKAGNTAYKAVNGVLFTYDGKTLISYPAGKFGNSYAVPEGTVTVGRSAFSDAYMLKTITFASSVRTIMHSAFAHCDVLASITFPSGITSIGDSALRECNKLTSVTFENPDVVLGPSVFADCDGLVSIQLPTRLKELSYGMFSDCAKLKNVTIPSTVTKMGSTVFADCDSLVSITVPGNVKSLGQQAFDFCNNLETIIFEEGVESLGWICIRNAPSLKKVVLPSSITTIEKENFEECPNVVVYVNCGSVAHRYAQSNGVATSVTHSYKTTITVPTCTTQGHTTHTCAVCGSSYKDAYVSALGHSYGDWEIVKESTCTEQGIERRDCVRCDVYETQVIEITAHPYESIVTSPTCTEQGYTTHTCSVCGGSYVDSYVDATGHTEVKDASILPTFKSSGLTEGKHCSVCKTVLLEQTIIPAKGIDTILEDNEFKLLLIGNSYSQDASNCGQSMMDSQLLNILQSMLGDDVKVTVGLIQSGGKGVNWHATQAELNKKTYGFTTITSELPTWKSMGSVSSAQALTWTDWDMVSLQPYNVNTTTGKESVSYPDSTSEKFYLLEVASEFMLDYINKYAPQADVYCYMHWAQTSQIALNANLSSYNKMAKFYPETLDYVGTESGKVFADIIPVGLSVQNARTTYLALLAYNTSAYADGNLNLVTDAQIGLQRDGGHLSFNIGRYIAALTFAETLVPEALRVDNYVLPNIRKTESIGVLPVEYSTIAQMAVAKAVDSWKQESLSVTTIEGYSNEPVSQALKELEDKAISVVCTASEMNLQAQITGQVLSVLPADFTVERIVLPADFDTSNNTKFTVTVTARFGYTSKDVSITVSLGSEHSFSQWFTSALPTCTENGTERRDCKNCDHSETRAIAAKGHTEVIDEAVAPTCTETGLTEGKHCSVCDAVLVKQEVVAAKGHDYKSVVTAPTCTEQGYTTHTCTVCGDNYVDSYVDATGHSYGGWTVTTAPTCTEQGTERRDCKNCDHFETRDIAAKGHTEVVDKAVAPTCTETGLTEGKHCSVCYAVLVKQEVVAAKGHDYKSVVTAPTCTERGYTTHTCTICGNSYVDGYVDAAGHSYGEWSVTTAPTCTEQGTERRDCKNCDHFETHEVAAKGHTEVIDKAVAPTCTETGLTEGKHCSVCDAVLVKQEVVKANGHDYDAVVTAPTCTEQGYTTHTCSVCGNSYVDGYVDATGHSYGEWTVITAPTCTEKGTERRDCKNCDHFETRTIAAKGHTEVIDKAVAPTCTETGLTEGKHCSVCDAVLVKQEVVAAKGHSYKSVVTAPTCTEQGYTTHTCTICGNSYVDGYVNAKGHSYGAWTVTTAPTCTEQGVERRDCKNCDHFETREVAAKGHTEVIDKAVAPTCTETGLTEGKHCSVCTVIIVAPEILPALGHKYAEWFVSVDATCTAEGEEKRECERCDAFETKVIAALGHTEVIDAAMEATCIADGLTEGKHCSVCETVLVAQEIVPPLGHTFGAFAPVSTDPELGHYQQCLVCDHISTVISHADTDENTWCDDCNYSMLLRVQYFALSHEYILLTAGECAELLPIIEPAGMANRIVWSSSDETVFIIDEKGVISAKVEGTAYAEAYVTSFGEEYTMRCRVDVSAEPIEEIELKAHIGVTNVTSNIYSTNYAETEIILDLPHYMTEISTFGLRGNGISLESAYFVDASVAALFDLCVTDDRVLQLIPKVDTDDAAALKMVKSSYKSAIAVTLVGEEEPLVTPEVLNIRVDKKLPTVKATAVKLNTFFTTDTKPLVLTSTAGKVTAIEVVAQPDWLTVDCEMMQVSIGAQNGKYSGKLKLLATVEGYTTAVPVTVSVSAAVTKPKVNLSSTSATIFNQAELSEGISLSVLSSDKKIPYEDLGITNITLAELSEKEVKTYAGNSVYEITDFDITTGQFLVSVREGIAPISGKVLLKVTFNDIDSQFITLPLSIELYAKAPVLKLSKTSATLNNDLGIGMDSFKAKLTVTPADYNYGALDIHVFDKTGKIALTDVLNVQNDGDTVIIRTTANTEYNAMYKVTVGLADDPSVKPVTITIKTLPVNKGIVTLTLTGKGSIDTVRPYATSITLTPRYKNYNNFGVMDEDFTVLATNVKAKPQVSVDVTEKFDIIRNANGTYTLKVKNGEHLDPTLKYTISMSSENMYAKAESKAISLSVKQGSVKVSQSTKRVNLYKSDRFSRRYVMLSIADETVLPIDRIELQNADKSLFEVLDFGNGLCAIGFKDSRVAPKVRNGSIKLNVFLQGNDTAKPNATVSLSVNVVAFR